MDIFPLDVAKIAQPLEKGGAIRPHSLDRRQNPSQDTRCAGFSRRQLSVGDYAVQNECDGESDKPRRFSMLRPKPGNYYSRCLRLSSAIQNPRYHLMTVSARNNMDRGMVRPINFG